ncbi:MAG TPA: sensor histidine kinase [Solirubrobacteraceae bacterium]
MLRQSGDNMSEAFGHAAPGIPASEPAGEAARRFGLPPTMRISMAVRHAGSLRWRLGGLVLLGGAAATWVGYLTSEHANPPSVLGVSGRVATIMVLILTGVWAQTSGSRERMARLLVFAGFFSCLWLLQGSSDRVLFSVGVLCSGVAAVLFCYLMLAHPTGQLHSLAEKRLIGVAGGLGVACWVFAVVTTTQPAFSTPLIRCAPHCPRNALFLGFSTGAVSMLKVVTGISWMVLAAGVVLLLVRRMRSASPPARRAIAPVLLVATVFLLSSGGFIVAKSAAPHLAAGFGLAVVSVAILIPLAIGLGLITERLFMGQALEGFVNQLAGADPLQLEAQMAAALHDPSLRIAYRRPISGTYVDASGAFVAVPALGGRRAVVEIKRDDHPIALVIHDGQLSDQRRAVQAAGGAAMMWLENARLQADLRASVAELADSRARLVETADTERRRIERDLHDGVQQHLVGTRVRLQLATDIIGTEPQEAERMLAAIAQQIDEALDELRALARGVYPPLLEAHGLGEALKSATRHSPAPVSVHAHGIGRYRADLERAVYFCCLEALQNAAKHAGPGATARIDLWQQRQQLFFEISDTGPGFTPGHAQPGTGLVNMRDRIEAAGGSLVVISRPTRGTLIRGAVPTA